MTFAGKAYFDAVSKIGENAAVSPVSRELGEYYSKSSPIGPNLVFAKMDVLCAQRGLTFPRR